MSRRIVIGTAGHIDHGKSALVRALTGTDPDRLEEERRRGITIDLGFAHLDLGGGLVAGVVDVPGHERFVRTMVAGAGGVDLVVLVVAADEGVMPQTREHLDICRLLGLRRGIVALTKADLLEGLEPGWADLVRGDVADTVKGTFLEGAEVVQVSARTGDGLEALRAALVAAVGETDERPADGPLFLPVDRAFTLKGFGTVVTGTLLSGAVAPEDEVELVPGGPRLRVRGVQVHGEAAEAARAGQRTAANLSGIEKDRVSRGQVLVAPGARATGRLLDVSLEALPALDRPLRQRRALELHLGTGHAEATLILLEDRQLAPGGRGLAQLHLDREVAVLPGQRFILRGPRTLAGRGRTLAGGRVLALAEKRRRPSRPGALDGLARLAGDDDGARVEALVRLAGTAGLPEADLPYATGRPKRVLARLVEGHLARRRLFLADPDARRLVHPDAVAALETAARQALADHHGADPLSAGLSKEALRAALPGPPPPRLFHRVLGALVDAGDAELDTDRVRLAGAGGALAGDAADEGARLLDRIQTAALTPPRVKDLAADLGLDAGRAAALLGRLADAGEVVKVKDDLYFATPALAELERRLVAYLDAHGAITTQAFKDLTGATRKHAIPLSEHFDRQHVTLRVGDKRVRRGAASRANG